MELPWIVLLAVISILIVTVSAALQRDSFVLDQFLDRIERIFTRGDRESTARYVFRAVAQVLLVLIYLERRTSPGRLDLGCVSILAVEVLAGWDKVIPILADMVDKHPVAATVLAIAVICLVFFKR